MGVIPINRDKIHRVADQIITYFEELMGYEGSPLKTRESEIGTRKIVGTYQIENVRGRSKEVDVYVALDTYSEEITGEYNKAPEIVLYIPEYWSLRKLKNRKTELVSVLAHEWTHARDVAFSKGPESSYFENYINYPHEVRGWTRQVIEQIRNIIPADETPSREEFRRILKERTSWPTIRTYLEPQNKKNVLRGLYRAVMDPSSKVSKIKWRITSMFDRIARKYVWARLLQSAEMTFDESSLQQLDEDIQQISRIYESAADAPTEQKAKDRTREANQIFETLQDRLERFTTHPKIDDRTRMELVDFLVDIPSPIEHHFGDGGAGYEFSIRRQASKIQSTWSDVRSRLEDLLASHGGSIEMAQDTIYHIDGMKVNVTAEYQEAKDDSLYQAGDVIEQIEQAQKLMEQRGFDGSITDRLEVQIKAEPEPNQSTTKGGTYFRNDDVVALYDPWDTAREDIVETMVHEVGHRLHLRYLSDKQRQRWNQVIEDSKVTITSRHIETYAREIIEKDPSDPIDMVRSMWTSSDWTPEMYVALRYLAREIGMRPQYRWNSVDENTQNLDLYTGDEAFIEEITYYAQTDVLEAFAEVMKLYVMEPSELGPWTTSFFESVTRRYLSPSS